MLLLHRQYSSHQFLDTYHEFPFSHHSYWKLFLSWYVSIPFSKIPWPFKGLKQLLFLLHFHRCRLFNFEFEMISSASIANCIKSKTPLLSGFLPFEGRSWIAQNTLKVFMTRLFYLLLVRINCTIAGESLVRALAAIVIFLCHWLAALHWSYPKRVSQWMNLAHHVLSSVKTEHNKDKTVL